MNTLGYLSVCKLSNLPSTIIPFESANQNGRTTKQHARYYRREHVHVKSTRVVEVMKIFICTSMFFCGEGLVEAILYNINSLFTSIFVGSTWDRIITVGTDPSLRMISLATWVWMGHVNKSEKTVQKTHFPTSWATCKQHWISHDFSAERNCTDLLHQSRKHLTF